MPDAAERRTPAVVLPFTPASTARGWRPNDIAEIYRIIDLLGRAGLAVSMETGCSDEGDPWIAVLRDDTLEVIVHIAKTDGQIIAVSAASDCVFTGSTLADALRTVLSTQTLIMPAEGTRIFLHPATILAAFIATALTHTSGEFDGGKTVDSELAEALYVAGHLRFPCLDLQASPRPTEHTTYSPALVTVAVSSVAMTIALTSDGLLPSPYRDPWQSSMTLVLRQTEVAQNEDETTVASTEAIWIGVQAPSEAVLTLERKEEEENSQISFSNSFAVRADISRKSTDMNRSNDQDNEELTTLVEDQYAIGLQSVLQNAVTDGPIFRPLFGASLMPITAEDWKDEELAWGRNVLGNTTKYNQSLQPHPEFPGSGSTTAAVPQAENVHVEATTSAEKPAVAPGVGLHQEGGTWGQNLPQTNVEKATIKFGEETLYWTGASLLGLVVPMNEAADKHKAALDESDDGFVFDTDLTGDTKFELAPAGVVKSSHGISVNVDEGSEYLEIAMRTVPYSTSSEAKAHILSDFAYDKNSEIGVADPVLDSVRGAINGNSYLLDVDLVIIFDAPEANSTTFMLMPNVAMMRSDSIDLGILQKNSANQVEFFSSDGSILRLLGVIDI